MKLYKQSFSSEVASKGLCKATISGIFDIGKQVRKSYDGKTPDKIQREFVFLFELDENRSDGKPFVLSQRYNATLDDRANLRKLISNVVGEITKEQEAEGFDTQSLIGRSCYVLVDHYKRKDGKNGAKLKGSPMPLKKGETDSKVQGDGKPPKWVVEVAKGAVEMPDWAKHADADSFMDGIGESDDVGF